MLQTDYIIGSPLNHQDPFIQRHGSQLTANELPPFRQPFTSRRGIRLAYSFPRPARVDLFEKCDVRNAKKRPFFFQIIDYSCGICQDLTFKTRNACRIICGSNILESHGSVANATIILTSAGLRRKITI